MFPSQATALGNTLLHLGMDADKENLKDGEEAFANRPRNEAACVVDEEVVSRGAGHSTYWEGIQSVGRSSMRSAFRHA